MFLKRCPLECVIHVESGEIRRLSEAMQAAVVVLLLLSCVSQYNRSLCKCYWLKLKESQS